MTTWRALMAMVLGAALASPARTQWKPADNPLMTRWAKDVAPERVHAEYPRPQMVRRDWANLNGLWDYQIASKDEPRPRHWAGKILVPFPVVSALSGVKQAVGPEKQIWCRRTFRLPDAFRKGGRRLLLHFGAVDWLARIYL